MAVGDTIFNKMIVRSIKVASNSTRWAAVYLPQDFYTNPQKKYPTMIWNHGSGEVGSGEAGLPELATGDGLPEEFNTGRMTNMKFVSPKDGLEYEFLLICPQNQSTGYPFAPSQLYYMWSTDPFLKDRIDTKNIFLSGLSLGGVATSRHLAESEASVFLKYYRGLFFLSAPRASGYGDPWDYTTAKALKTPIREYMGTQEVAGRVTFAREIRDSLNAVNPGQVYLHEYNAGHSGWQAFLQRSHRINGMNYGEWFLSLMVTDAPPEGAVIGTRRKGQKVNFIKL